MRCPCRARASAAVDRAPVPAGLDQPVGVLPLACRGDAAEPRADAADRRAVPGDALVRRAADGAAPAAGGLRGRPKAPLDFWLRAHRHFDDLLCSGRPLGVPALATLAFRV